MTKIIIELEFNGIRDEAYAVVDKVLDAGTIQDAIDEHAELLGYELKVTGAMTNAAPIALAPAVAGIALPGKRIKRI